MRVCTLVIAGSCCGAILTWCALAICASHLSSVGAGIAVFVCVLVCGFTKIDPTFSKFAALYTIFVIIASFASENGAIAPFVAVLLYLLEVVFACVVSLLVSACVVPHTATDEWCHVCSDTVIEFLAIWRLLLKGRGRQFQAVILKRAQVRHADDADNDSSGDLAELDAALIQPLDAALRKTAVNLVRLRTTLDEARWEDARHVWWWCFYPLFPAIGAVDTPTLSANFSDSADVASPKTESGPHATRLGHYSRALVELQHLHAQFSTMRAALLAGCPEAVHEQLVSPVATELSALEADGAHEFLACALELARDKSSDTVSSFVFESPPAETELTVIAGSDDMQQIDHNDAHADDASLSLFLSYRPQPRELRQSSCIDSLLRLERANYRARLRSFTDHSAPSSVAHGLDVPAAALAGSHWAFPPLNTYLFALRASVLTIMNVHYHVHSALSQRQESHSDASIPASSAQPIPPNAEAECAEDRAAESTRSYCCSGVANRWHAYSLAGKFDAHVFLLLARAVASSWSACVLCVSGLCGQPDHRQDDDAGANQRDESSASMFTKPSDDLTTSNMAKLSNSDLLANRCKNAFKVALVALAPSILIFVPGILASLAESVNGSSSGSFVGTLASSFKNNILWFPMSAVMVMEASVGASLRRGMLRVAGTIVGCVCGYLCALAYPDSIAPLIATLFFVVAFFCYFRRLPSLAYAGSVAALTLIIIVQSSGPGTSSAADSQSLALTALRRCALVLAGVLVSVLVNQLVWPQRARDEIGAALALAMRRIVHAYAESNRAFFCAPEALPIGRDCTVADLALQINAARHLSATALSATADDIELRQLPRARELCFEASAEPSLMCALVCAPGRRRLTFPAKRFHGAWPHLFFAIFCAFVHLFYIVYYSFIFVHVAVIIDGMEGFLGWLKIFQTCLDHNVCDTASLLQMRHLASKFPPPPSPSLRGANRIPPHSPSVRGAVSRAPSSFDLNCSIASPGSPSLKSARAPAPASPAAVSIDPSAITAAPIALSLPTSPSKPVSAAETTSTVHGTQFIDADSIYARDVVQSLRAPLDALCRASSRILCACADALANMDASRLTAMMAEMESESAAKDGNDSADVLVQTQTDIASIIALRRCLRAMESAHDRAISRLVVDLSANSESFIIPPSHQGQQSVGIQSSVADESDGGIGRVGLVSNPLFQGFGGTAQPSADSSSHSPEDAPAPPRHFPSMNVSFTFNSLLFASRCFCIDVTHIVGHTFRAISCEMPPSTDLACV